MFLFLTVLMIAEKLLFGVRPSKSIFLIIATITIYLCSFCGNEKKYIQLEKKYRNEKHKKMKGWLVVVYWIGSWMLSIITAIMLF